MQGPDPPWPPFIIEVEATEGGVRRIHLRGVPRELAEAVRDEARMLSEAAREQVRLATAWVEEFLAAPPGAPDPPLPARLRLDPARGTPFQRAVWEELRRIPRGETRTYGEVAAAIGRPGACRAVGVACGANPLPLLVPCHRVVAAGGRLGGFRGGLPWKVALLARESSADSGSCVPSPRAPRG